MRDAAIIGVAQRIEHYEIAAYGCARTYARRLNRLDEARLLQETLDEEGRTDHRLSGSPKRTSTTMRGWKAISRNRSGLDGAAIHSLQRRSGRTRGEREAADPQ